MDFISHTVLQYLLGCSFRLDKKMLTSFIIGGVAPDFDVFIVWLGIFLPSPDLLLIHRGIFHSLVFGLLIALAAMLLIAWPPGSDTFRQWIGTEFSLSLLTIGLAFVGVIMHLFLDYITIRGVPLLFPFDATRFSAELFFHYEFIISACSVVIALWLINGFFENRLMSRKTNNKLLALFLIAMLAVGGLRLEGKERAFDTQDDIVDGTHGNSQVYPDWGLFEWIILNQDMSSFQVYRYNALSNETSHLGTYPKLQVILDSSVPGYGSDMNFSNHLKDETEIKASASMDEFLDLEKALHLADSLPKVVLFRWSACSVAINATRENGSWLLEYYDPVGAAESPTWIPIIVKRILKQSPSIKVRVKGDLAYITA